MIPACLRTTLATTICAIGLASLAPAVQAAAIKSNTTATTSGGTLIDFEGVAQGINADNLYAGQGVTFAGAGGPTTITGSNSDANVNSGVNALRAPASDPTDTTMTFASAQSSVEFYLGDLSPLGDYVLTAFGAANVVLESFVLTLAEITADDSWFLGFTRGSADILSVGINPVVDNDVFFVDDLRFSASAAPAPATLALLGLGLFGLGLTRRRQAQR